MLVVASNHKSLRTPVRAFLDSPEAPDGFFLNIHDRPDALHGGPRNHSPRRSQPRARGHGGRQLPDLADRVLPDQHPGGAGAARAGPRSCRRGSSRPRPLQRQRPVRPSACPAQAHGSWRWRRTARRSRTPRRTFVSTSCPPMWCASSPPASKTRWRASVASHSTLVVLDPPRQGCPDGVIDAVCAHRGATNRVRFLQPGEARDRDGAVPSARIPARRVAGPGHVSTYRTHRGRSPLHTSSRTCRHEHTRTRASGVHGRRPAPVGEAYEVLLVRRTIAWRSWPVRSCFPEGAWTLPIASARPGRRLPERRGFPT